jgi:4-hydroxyproline epimerase
LAHLGRIEPGEHRIETPVGTVQIQLHPGNLVTIRNVPAYRYRTGVTVEVPGYSPVTGDVAWGGNWFFLVGDHPFRLTLDRVEPLTTYTWAIRRSLAASNITGYNGEEIDHIELFTPAHHPDNHSRNFVLCPGKAYDRSPCGTGTSAKIACLAAAGHLQEGQPWRQEGILDTVFEGSFRASETDPSNNGVPAGTKSIIPTVTGSAYVTAESTLIFDPADPFCLGVPE